jgi:hypothetical protein
MLSFTLTRSTSMPLELDPEKCLVKIPASYSIKGFLASDSVDIVERFGMGPTIELTIMSDDEVDYDIRW